MSKIDITKDYKMTEKETKREVIVPGHLVESHTNRGFILGEAQEKVVAKDNFKITKAKKKETTKATKKSDEKTDDKSAETEDKKEAKKKETTDK